MKKTLIAGASVLALAGAVMPMASVFADDDRDVTDTIKVTVKPSCTFSAGGDNASYEAADVNGKSVTPLNNTANVHAFSVFCNNNKGYTVEAEATALAAATTGNTDVFTYKLTLPSAGADGAWHAEFAAASDNTNTLTIAQLADGGAKKTIVTSGQASAADGETFTATYTAWIGTETPADTYTGTITYNLAPQS